MTKKVIMGDNKLKSQISLIVSSYCKEVPYEGTEVDKYAIIDSIVDLLTTTKEYSLLRHTILKLKVKK